MHESDIYMYLSSGGEKCIWLLCVSKLAFVKSSHNYIHDQYNLFQEATELLAYATIYLADQR